MLHLVQAPALRAAKNGLVEVGNRIDVGDERWEDGVTFTPHGCEAIFGHVPFCPAEDKSPYNDCSPPVRAVAYLLEVGLVWSMLDMAADPKAMLEEALEIGTSSVLERLSWMGVADVAGGTPITLPVRAGTITTTGIVGRVMGGATAPPTLAATALDTGYTGTTIPGAIGAVEAKLLDAGDHTGGAGTLFMSPVIAAQAEMALREDGGHLVTRATGSQVIVGNFPTDKVIGVIGDVDVYLGPIFVIEADKTAGMTAAVAPVTPGAYRTNEWVGRAERRAIAVWNSCGVFSADVTP